MMTPPEETSAGRGRRRSYHACLTCRYVSPSYPIVLFDVARPNILCQDGKRLAVRERSQPAPAVYGSNSRAPIPLCYEPQEPVDLYVKLAY